MVVKISENVKVKHPKKLSIKSNSLLIPTQVTEGISVLMQLTQKRKASEKKSALFNDEAKPIILQISAVKIPVTPTMQLRMILPHSLNAEGADVCLITKDVKRGTKNNHEPSLAHYQALLDEKKVEGITQIIPFRQLVNEHKPFEAKGRLAFMYDSYLVDGEILGKVSKIVGSRFFQRGKHLIPIKFGGEFDLKTEVSRALTKTAMTLHPNGDTYTVKVADTSFTEEQIKENIYAVVAALSDGLFPGGFDNIRSIYVKTPLSLAIPIYLTLKSSNKVPVPIVDPNLPKACKDESGELSTIVGGEVTVRPDGQILFRKRYTREDRVMGYKGGEDITDSEDDEYSDAVSDDEEAGEEAAPSDVVEESKPNAKKRKTNDDDADSSDDEVEAAEDAYLNEWQRDFEQKDATPLNETTAKPGKQPAAKKQKKEVTKQPTNEKQGKLVVKPETKKQKAQARADSSKILTAKVAASPVQAAGKKQKAQARVDSSKIVTAKVAASPVPGKKQKRKAADVISEEEQKDKIVADVETTKKGKAKKQKLQVPEVVPEVKATKPVKKEKLKKQKPVSIPLAVVAVEKETRKEESIIPAVGKKQKVKKEKEVVPIVAKKGLNIISAKKEEKVNKSNESIVNDLLKSAIKAVSSPPEEVKPAKGVTKSKKANQVVVPENKTPAKKEKVAGQKTKQSLVDELLKSAIKAVATPPGDKQEKLGKKVKKLLVVENGGPLKTLKNVATPTGDKTKKVKKALVENEGPLKTLKNVSTPTGDKTKKVKKALVENEGPLKTVKTNKSIQSMVDDLLKSAREAVATPPEKKAKKSKENKKTKEEISKLMNVSEVAVPVQSKKKSPKALKKDKKQKSTIKGDGNFISLMKGAESAAVDTPITKKKKKEATYKGLSLADFGTDNPHEKQALRYFKQKTQK